MLPEPTDPTGDEPVDASDPAPAGPGASGRDDEATHDDQAARDDQPARDAGRLRRGARVAGRTTRDGALTVTRTVGRTTRDGARAVGTTARSGARLLVDRVSDIAPRIPVRDLDTLRRHHDGLEGEALADALVDSAARTTSAFGAAGGVAAVRLALRRNPLTFAVQVLAEPVAVAAVEIKLMAELHEVYDVQVPGTGADRARHFARAWATARGVNPLDPQSARSSLGEAVKGNLGRTFAARMGSRFMRSGPFVAGAAAGGLVNGRGTRELADGLRVELRRLGAADDQPTG